jgi:hypothetical protein
MGSSAAGYRGLLERELGNFKSAKQRGDIAAAWHALGRAHVISQGAFVPHGKIHFTMLGFAIEQRDPREIIGQFLRLLLVPLGHALHRLPVGNTGLANVSAFKPMPLPDDLAAEMAGLTPKPQ